MTTSQALRRRVVFLLLGCEAFVCLPSLRRLLFVPSRDRLLGLLPSSLLVPVSQALRQARVLLEAPRPLHELLVRRLLLERPLAQQLQHVCLVQDLPLQETLPHLRETSELNTGTNQELFNLRLFFGVNSFIAFFAANEPNKIFFFFFTFCTPWKKRKISWFLKIKEIKMSITKRCWSITKSFSHHFFSNTREKKRKVSWKTFFSLLSFTHEKKILLKERMFYPN